MMKYLVVLSALTMLLTGSKLSANPFLEKWSTPFGVPPFDHIKQAHYMPAFEEGMKQHNQEIEAIAASDAARARIPSLLHDRAFEVSVPVSVVALDKAG